MSKVVTVLKTRSGHVVNASSNNPAEGWVMVESSEVAFLEGRLFNNTRHGFLRGKVTDLQGLGLTEGQQMPGKIVIKDSLTPIIAESPAFGLRVPQSGKTAEERSAVRNAANAAGLTFMAANEDGELLPIYRKTYYSPNADEQDTILPVANKEQVAAFIATVVPSTANTPALQAARDTKAAELANA